MNYKPHIIVTVLVALWWLAPLLPFLIMVAMGILLVIVMVRLFIPP